MMINKILSLKTLIDTHYKEILITKRIIDTQYKEKNICSWWTRNQRHRAWEEGVCSSWDAQNSSPWGLSSVCATVSQSEFNSHKTPGKPKQEMWPMFLKNIRTTPKKDWGIRIQGLRKPNNQKTHVDPKVVLTEKEPSQDNPWRQNQVCRWEESVESGSDSGFWKLLCGHIG